MESDIHELVAWAGADPERTRAALELYRQQKDAWSLSPSLLAVCRRHVFPPHLFQERLYIIARTLNLCDEESDCYRILEVDRTATEEEIKRSFRRLSLKHHPDVNPDDPEASRRFQDIRQAYEVLRDPGLRARHDLRLETSARAVHPPPPGEKPPSVFRRRSGRIWLQVALPVAALVLISFAVDFQGFVSKRYRKESMKPRKSAMVLDNDTEGPASRDPEVGDKKPADSLRDTVKNPLPSGPKESATQTGPASRSPDAPAAALRPVLAQPTRPPTGKPGEGKDSSVIRKTAQSSASPESEEEPPPPPRKAVASQPIAHAASSETKEAAGISENRAADEKTIRDLAALPEASQASSKPSAEARAEAQAEARKPSHNIVDEMDEKVERFLRRYVQAYEEKDLKRLRGLFEASAVQNGRSILEIFSAYQRNFTRAHSIHYRILPKSWILTSYGVELESRFHLRVEFPGLRPQHSLGALHFKLARRGDGLRIRSLESRPLSGAGHFRHDLLAR